MSKFLLIGSIAAMLYGDCAWGMGDDIDPWKGTSSGAGQFNAEPARGDASPNIRSRRNSTTFSRDAQTQTEQSPFEQSWSGQAHANPQQLEENRFIKDNGYRQYHYVPSNNSKIGRATPTKINSVSGDLRCWNDISEIRYANDVSYDKLENPKVILYRNKDNSCYIILRIGDNKHGVFYGVNERNVEIGRQSFAVYEVSEDVGSFTDGVPRRIYVDESGLYFVPIEGNSIKDVIKTYQNEGKFNFKGSVIKVSAIDGTITLDGEPVTANNFFDNWVKKEEQAIPSFNFNPILLSTKQPGEKEVLRNFYPPSGRYERIYFQKNERGEYKTESMDCRGGIIWLNSLVNKRVAQTKATDRDGAEELVRDGTFASILSLPDEGFIAFGSKLGLDQGYYRKVCDAVAAQIVAAKKERTQTGSGFSFGNSSSATPKSISAMVSQNLSLFKNPDFVRKLKPAFKELEKDYEHNKESELWLPFEIVRNL
ncbi:MAG: hypothetical protein J6S86_01925 [Alphaproteobacteria bacterium]|nr:hypothetical protein [Alphaproteobacteria bacterium]